MDPKRCLGVTTAPLGAINQSTNMLCNIVSIQYRHIISILPITCLKIHSTLLLEISLLTLETGVSQNSSRIISRVSLLHPLKVPRLRKALGSGPRETFTAPLAAGMVKGPPLSPSGSTAGVSPGTSPTGTNVVLPHQWRRWLGGKLDVRAMFACFFCWFLTFGFQDWISLRTCWC